MPLDHSYRLMYLHLKGVADITKTTIPFWLMIFLSITTISPSYFEYMLQLLLLEPPFHAPLIGRVLKIAAKWTKLLADYVPKSTIVAMTARNKGYVGFVMEYDIFLLAMKHRVEDYVDECLTFLVTTSMKSNVLLTRPTPNWRTFCDVTGCL